MKIVRYQNQLGQIEFGTLGGSGKDRKAHQSSAAGKRMTHP